MPSFSEPADPVNPQRRGAARTAAESIARYTPVLARPEDWEGIADFVRAGVSAMQPAGPHQAREWMRTLTALTVWAQHEGLPLDREEILAPDTVQRYCEIGCLELDVQSRATRRSVLRRMGRELTVTAPWPEPETPLPGRNRHAPYNDREIARLCALKQSTPKLQRRLDAFLALGLGAGLWAREYLTTTGDALAHDGDTTVLRVTGNRARIVTVRSIFAPTLWRLALPQPTDRRDERSSPATPSEPEEAETEPHEAQGLRDRPAPQAGPQHQVAAPAGPWRQHAQEGPKSVRSATTGDYRGRIEAAKGSLDGLGHLTNDETSARSLRSGVSFIISGRFVDQPLVAGQRKWLTCKDAEHLWSVAQA